MKQQVNETIGIISAIIGLLIGITASFILLYAMRNYLGSNIIPAATIFSFPVILSLVSLFPNIGAFVLTMKERSIKVAGLQLCSAICLTLAWGVLMAIIIQGEYNTSWQYQIESLGMQKLIWIILYIHDPYVRPLVEEAMALFKSASPIIGVALIDFAFSVYLSRISRRRKEEQEET